ncbi:MAG: Smr/MutS family protein, partial [Chloroflexota bacterium]|nr:Smr/MutS family protein [Chloroflexota bacterium]
ARQAPSPGSGQALPVAQQEIEAVEEQVEKLRQKRKRRKPGPLPPIAAGDHVWLRDLAQPAEALGPPDEQGELEVRLGSFHAKIRVSEIEQVEKAPTSVGAAVPSSWPVVSPPPPELDVRGLSVGEALPLIDQHLDAAFRAGLPQVRIVHGKGTGTLRRAIRDALSGHPLVKSLATPPPKEGGEGVTVVEIAG